MLSDEAKIALEKSINKYIKERHELASDENKQNSPISTESTNDLNINLNQNRKKYVFKSSNISYSLYIYFLEETIKITVYKIKEKVVDDYYYERDFSQEDLRSINKVFKLCNDIRESFEYFNDLFKNEENQISLSESNDVFKIEKKMQISKTLILEIPKISKNNSDQNNIIKEAFIENNNKLNKDKKDGNINASSLIELNEMK